MLLAQLLPWGKCVESQDVATIACAGIVIIRILQIVGTIALFVFFIMTIIAGFRMLASQGDPKALERARGTLIHALLGLVLLVFAFLILQLIGAFSGVNVLQFSLP